MLHAQRIRGGKSEFQMSSSLCAHESDRVNDMPLPSLSLPKLLMVMSTQEELVQPSPQQKKSDIPVFHVPPIETIQALLLANRSKSTE